MPHDHAFRGGEGPAVDVEVTTADVGSHDLQDNTVGCLLAVGHLELREVQILNLHVLHAAQDDGTVACLVLHSFLSSHTGARGDSVQPQS